MKIGKVAFVGLGVMGYPMAGHLASKGYHVSVYDRTHSKAELWVEEYSGTAAKSPAKASLNAQVVFICVSDDNDLRDVVFADDGLLTIVPSGTIIVDHTTASALLAKEIHEKALSKGVGFLDAPVSGGGAGAKKGLLSIMVGGNPDDFSNVLPLLECYGKTINLMGPSGSGQLTKMVNQICIAATLQGVAEAIRFGMDANLDMEKVLRVIAGGAAQSWQLENRGPWMLDERYKGGGFAVDLIKKDLTLCMEQASIASSPVPVTEMVNGFFTTLQDQGKGKWDFSSLIELLSNNM